MMWIKNIFRKTLPYFPVMLAGFFLSGCNTGPEPIQFGEEQCAYCKMTIVDQKFGAELVTQKGRVYKFDALECMIPYKDENPDQYSHELAIAYDNPGKLYPVTELVFMHSEKFNSPMGSNVAAFSAEENIPPEATKVEWPQLEEKFASN